MRLLFISALSLILLQASALASENIEKIEMKSKITPEYLRCEYKINPLGIDVKTPRLSWIVTSSERAQKQTAYRILVGSSEKILAADTGDLWDSGNVKSGETNQIVYAGKQLSSEMHCYWKVKVWDGDGNESDWSKPAFWTMGLLSETEWSAQWIGYDAPLDESVKAPTFNGSKWIWFAGDEGDPKKEAPSEPRYFRKEVKISADAVINEAILVISADDGFVAYVNGRQVGKGETISDNWRKAQMIDVTKELKSGRNIIAVEVTNLPRTPAGLIVKILVKKAKGNPIVFVSDDTWLSNNTDNTNWYKPEFDDSKWQKAKIAGEFGCDPWALISTGVLVLPPPRYLRKEFSVGKPVRRATVYASALGLYELHVNGERIGDDYFTSGWTDYDKRIYYNTYDVTALIQKGGNAIGAILGDGWYAGYVGWGHVREHYGNKPRFRAQLHIEFEDGTKHVIATNRSWKATTGPILESDFLMGETYDANKEITGWNSSDYDDSKWAGINVTEKITAKIEAHPGVPVRKFAEIKPLSVNEPAMGNYVFDMGQNFAGFVRLKIKSSKGTKIVLRFAERLNPDGTIYTKNLRRARVTDTYICKGGGEEVWEPKFTFHGFHYVEMTGCPAKPSLDAITGIALSSDTPVAGSFECSDSTANRLYKNIYWTQRANFIELPTDCPQRDERLGWTGDAQIYIRTAANNTDVSAFFTKWLVDLEDGQLPDGAFPDVAPRKIVVGGGSAAWADAGVVCPWTIYEMYGDTRVLEKHYDAMTRWIDYCVKNSEGLLRPNRGYGDWLAINAVTPTDVLSTAYFAKSTRITAQTARVIGKMDDAKKYDKLFDDIKNAFNKAYVSDNGRIKGDTQTVYVLALAFDILPENMRVAALNYLVEDIKKRGWILSTGFVGTKDLMGVLRKFGRNDVAYRLFHNDVFPSWGFSIKHGATSIWERWDGWTPENGFQDYNMNSFAHYAFGAVGEWMFKTIGGIDTDGVGFKKITIKPQPGERLTYAKTTYNSINGLIVSDWKMEGNKLALKVTIPANTTARIYVPVASEADVTESGKLAATAEGLKFIGMDTDRGCAVFEAGSGNYEFLSTSAKRIEEAK